MPRQRQQILDNLDAVYREAYDRAEQATDARPLPIPSAPSRRSVASPDSGRRCAVSRPQFAASFLALALAACTPKADLVIQGGSVWTGLSTGRGRPGTVAIANGKILAVGDSAEVARYVGAETKVLRADGGVVVPGLADG